jgi:FKBP-type peptidyl-prolyl cis-trans isomerase
MLSRLSLVCCSLALVGCAGLASSPVAAEPGPTDKDAPEKFTTTASGLQYRILRKSKGDKPLATDKVTVHYRGWLDNKTEFDSSYKRGEPATFPLTNVIKGWTEGLQLVTVGGMIELTIPANLGYGDRGAGGTIPPGATLHFVVELVEIK